jgi:hypothetical protein
MSMAVKTITIDMTAYEMLAGEKRTDESSAKRSATPTVCPETPETANDGITHPLFRGYPTCPHASSAVAHHFDCRIAGLPLLVDAIGPWKAQSRVRPLNLQVFPGEACSSSYPGQHMRADFHAVMKGKDIVRPIWPREYTMGCSGLAFDRPTDAKQCRQYEARLA